VLAGRAEGARKRAAIETYVRHEDALLRTARRYSLCDDDADDALQRGLEILLTKAPTSDPRELIRWTQTVVKHEALAVRRDRERTLSGPAALATEPGREDWVALLPADADGPPERAERREAIARSREALQALKPQELRALGLLAEGYSYKEIGEITGFSHTKINRSLAEGRERFRSLLSRGEDGSRCEEMRPLLSAFCDGEAAEDSVATLREHLRACGSCRATLRAYRAAPGAVAALAPALPAGRSLLDRIHDLFADLTTRFGGGAGDSALSQVAATGGVGTTALAKAVAACVGSAGAAAACVATGMVPAPLDVGPDRVRTPTLERTIDPAITTQWSDDSGVEYEPAPAPVQPPRPSAPTRPEAKPEPVATAEPVPAVAAAPASEAVEYAPPPEPAAAPETGGGGAGGSGGGDPAGEFGP
jgi:RNA polymerase sigma factor (sigma-70 family)